MNKRLRSKFTSYQNVQTVLHNYDEEVQKVPVLIRYRDILDGKISAIDQAEKEYQTVNVGTIGNKNSIAEIITEELDSLCGVLNVWAQETGDKKIEELTDLTITEIGDMKGPDLSDKAKQIHGLCVERKSELQDYDVSSEEIDTFGNLINQFSDSLKKAQSESDVSVVIHSDQKTMFAETDKFLKEKLDKIVKRRKKANSEFVSLYLKARVAKVLGVRHENNQNPPNPAESQVEESPKPVATEK